MLSVQKWLNLTKMPKKKNVFFLPKTYNCLLQTLNTTVGNNSIAALQSRSQQNQERIIIVVCRRIIFTLDFFPPHSYFFFLSKHVVLVRCVSPVAYLHMHGERTHHDVRLQAKLSNKPY